MISRRNVMALGGSAVVAGMMTPAWAGIGPIRIGLVGADSEGIVLVKDAMRADARVRLVAIADESSHAAWRALMVFAHPLRRGGMHPQLDMDEGALFAGADAGRRMTESVPLDAVLLVGSGQAVADALLMAAAAGVDAYVKPLGDCEGASGAIVEAAGAAAARGLIIGADVPWRHEAWAVPLNCRLSYARTEHARVRSFADFLAARSFRLDGQGELAERLGVSG